MAHYGVYSGMVMNTADPMMKGRLQISLPGISGPPTAWAMPCREFGSKTTPVIGTSVWVMFEQGDVDRPVWIGCAN